MIRRIVNAAALLVLAALTSTSSALAATASAVLTVESVLSPAWVERANGRREPLAAGMALANKEKVHTGDGGRCQYKTRPARGASRPRHSTVPNSDDANTAWAAAAHAVRSAFSFGSDVEYPATKLITRSASSVVGSRCNARRYRRLQFEQTVGH